MKFRRLCCSRHVRRMLEELPASVTDCLIEAIQQIKSGRLALGPGTSLLRTTEACDFQIAVSVIPQDETGEVVGLLSVRSYG